MTESAKPAETAERLAATWAQLLLATSRHDPAPRPERTAELGEIEMVMRHKFGDAGPFRDEALRLLGVDHLDESGRDYGLLEDSAEQISSFAAALAGWTAYACQTDRTLAALPLHELVVGHSPADQIDPRNMDAGRPILQELRFRFVDAAASINSILSMSAPSQSRPDWRRTELTGPAAPAFSVVQTSVASNDVRLAGDQLDGLRSALIKGECVLLPYWGTMVDLLGVVDRRRHARSESTRERRWTRRNRSAHGANRGAWTRSDVVEHRLSQQMTNLATLQLSLDTIHLKPGKTTPVGCHLILTKGQWNDFSALAITMRRGANHDDVCERLLSYGATTISSAKSLTDSFDRVEQALAKQIDHLTGIAGGRAGVIELE